MTPLILFIFSVQHSGEFERLRPSCSQCKACFYFFDQLIVFACRSTTLEDQEGINLKGFGRQTSPRLVMLLKLSKSFDFFIFSFVLAFTFSSKTNLETEWFRGAENLNALVVKENRFLKKSLVLIFHANFLWTTDLLQYSLCWLAHRLPFKHFTCKDAFSPDT